MYKGIPSCPNMHLQHQLWHKCGHPKQEPFHSGFIHCRAGATEIKLCFLVMKASRAVGLALGVTFTKQWKKYTLKNCQKTKKSTNTWTHWKKIKMTASTYDNYFKTCGSSIILAFSKVVICNSWGTQVKKTCGFWYFNLLWWSCSADQMAIV